MMHLSSRQHNALVPTLQSSTEPTEHPAAFRPQAGWGCAGGGGGTVPTLTFQQSFSLTHSGWQINTYIVFSTQTAVVAASLTEHCRSRSNVVHYGEEVVSPAGPRLVGRAAAVVALPRWSRTS